MLPNAAIIMSFLTPSLRIWQMIWISRTPRSRIWRLWDNFYRSICYFLTTTWSLSTKLKVINSKLKRHFKEDIRELEISFIASIILFLSASAISVYEYDHSSERRYKKRQCMLLLLLNQNERDWYVTSSTLVSTL